MELADMPEVKTESIGEGEDRKVVIKPVGELEGLE
jgi:predicted RNA-binding protein Jag